MVVEKGGRERETGDPGVKGRESVGDVQERKKKGKEKKEGPEE